MRLLSLLTVLSLLLAACGDEEAATTDDPTADESETDSESDPDTETEIETDTETEARSEGPFSTEDYAAVLAKELQTGQSFPGTKEQIACVSTGFVDAIGGADTLNEAGLTPKDLAAAKGPDDLRVDLDVDAVADELVTSFDDCDYDLIRLLAESLGPDAPAGFEDCVRGELTNDDIAAVFARLIIDPTDEQAADKIIPQIEACATETPEG